MAEQKILDWIDQFQAGDRDLAARILDVVDFYPIRRIEAGFKAVLDSLPGWHPEEAKRIGKWRFCEFSAGPGTSAGVMMHHFKYANNLTAKQFRRLFIGASEILQAGLGASDTLVLVDDFVGTGTQATTAFDDFFSELIVSIGKVYLVTVAARKPAIDRILEHTEIVVRPANVLTEKDSPFASAHFDGSERDKLLAYGARAEKKQPKGFGDCGLVVVFYHNCPNNSLPILHAKSKKWTPLFPRHC